MTFKTYQLPGGPRVVLPDDGQTYQLPGGPRIAGTDGGGVSPSNQLKYFNGTTWTLGTLKQYSLTNWVDSPAIKRWNGSEWVT